MLPISDRLKKDPKYRAEYFKFHQGRPTDKLIVETIRKRINQIIKQGFTGGGVFATEQLLYPLWQELPTQHQYIGQHIGRLIEEYGLAIQWYDAKSNGHVLYMIILDY
jgi:hypothetical protein